jgi:2-polyprenyl-6-methoxyphenol hydroxylase-like FAD-dependent oxidoreductase
MFLDASFTDLTGVSKSNVLIVGSGPVGLILGVALENLGFSVLILEAGGYFLDKSVQDDLHGQCVGAALPGLSVGRTRQIGGGLNVWGGQLALLEDGDLLRVGTNGWLSWPISHDELYDSMGEVLKILDATAIDLHVTPGSIQRESRLAHRYGLKMFRTAWLRRPTLGSAFWANLRRTRSITLVYNLSCVGIDYDASSERVSGVVATSTLGKRVCLKAGHTILAAGSLENARLLLLPTAKGGRARWHDYKWLGAGFNEHIDATTARIEIVNRSRINDIFDPIVYRGFKYSPKITWAESHRTGREITASGILIWPQHTRNALSELVSLGRALFVQRQVRDMLMLPKVVASSVRQIFPLAYRYARQRRIGSFSHGDAYLGVSTEQPVRVESKITLSTHERDRHGVPRLVVNWVRGGEELSSLREFTAAVQCWLEKEKLAVVHIDPSLARGDLEFLDKTYDGLHHAGTTRMGRSQATSVVDTDLRVHGVRNLYVCGASTFPSSGCANPTLTAMALAVRLAKTIAADETYYPRGRGLWATGRHV